MAILKYALYFLLFFTLFYFENGLSLLGMSLSQIWKIPLSLCLFIYLISHIRHFFPAFCKANVLYSLKQFLSPQIFTNFKICIDAFSRNILLALFYIFFYFKYKNRREKLEKLLYILSVFIILSSVPVLLGWVTPFIQAIDSSRFDIEGLSYFSGIFGSYHSASAYFAAASIIIVYKLRQPVFVNRNTKIFNILLLSISLYSLFLTYIRTGWLIFIIGLLILVKPKKMALTKTLKYASVLLAFFSLLFVFYNSNEAFRARIENRNIYSATDSDFDKSGSGRTIYWRNGVELWYNGSTKDVFLGVGYDRVAENNLRIVGMRIFSHSQFVDALAQNGIVGLILLVSFYWLLYKYIKKRKQSRYYNLGLSVFYMMLLFGIFQAEPPFLMAVISSMIFALLEIDYKSNENINSNTVI